MADHDSIVSSDKLKAIADAIREKTHKDNLMTLDEMPDEIASISGGGGATPECGVVPTSWSSNGFVLSADSYGDVLPGALYSATTSSYGKYPNDTHDADIPGNIDIYDDDLDQFEGQQIFNYLKSINFVTVPEYIGKEAFKNQLWMQLTTLPEGLEIIGDDAFYNCYNVTLSAIPSTVTEIGRDAFYNSNHPDKLVVYYDSTSTYDIGDTVYYMGDTYTCIVAIVTPEEFDSDKWVLGYYPAIVGVYNPAITYHTGDVVCYDAGSELKVGTCCEITETQGGNWGASYCPQIAEPLDSSHSYQAGDIVAGPNPDGYYSDIYTCYKAVSNPNSFDSDYWIFGYYPELLGEYDSNHAYSIGDVVVFKYGSDADPTVFTCVEATSVGDEFDTNSWAWGYGPGVIGKLDSSANYNVGDIVATDDSNLWTIECVIVAGTGQSVTTVANYWPNITTYSNLESYFPGDTVVFEDTYGYIYAYTCIRATSPGDAPEGSGVANDYWIEGYYPGLLGVYDSTIAYNKGDVVYSDYEHRVPSYSATGVYTLVTPPQTTTTTELYDGYMPDVIEMYNPNHTYYPGDVIATYDSYVSCYVCVSPTPVTGAWDEYKWEDLTTSSGGDFVVTKLYFLCELSSSHSSIELTSSGYSVIFVPWEESDGPELVIHSAQHIIYGYQAPDQNT